MKIYFTKLEKERRHGQIMSTYSYNSEEKALAAGAEMQDSMEAEWQNKYAELHHDARY